MKSGWLRTVRVSFVGGMITAIGVVLGLSFWLLLWPMWQDYRTVEVFIEAARSKDSKRIDAALERMKELRGTQPALNRLVQALKEDGYMVSRALGTLGSRAEGAVPLLIDLLNHEVADKRFVAAEALGEIGPPAKAAVPALLSRRNDEQENRGVRWNAAAALFRIKPETELQFWTERELRAVPISPSTGPDIRIVGSFKLINPIAAPPLVLQLVHRRNDGSRVIANSCATWATMDSGGRCSYSATMLDARGPQGSYELVALSLGIELGTVPLEVVAVDLQQDEG